MLKLEPAALTDVGRKRSNNQDYLGDLIFRSGRKYGPEKLNERGHLFAVADGMGGYAGGEVASELAITTLFERYYNGATSGDIGTDLSDAIKAANLKVHTEASGSGRPQMGTTLTTVLVKGNKAIFGNVGDSRTYLIRQGLAERVTHDHSLVQDQIDAGVLTPEQAERSAIKNFITRAIGHRDDVESDLFEREIQPGDVLLLCSDGLHGLVKEQEMGTLVATADTMQNAAQELVDLANERGGHDNISVMLIKVEDVGEALPNILNGREPIYTANRNLYNQTTEPLGAMTASSAATVSQADRATVPSAYPEPLGAAPTPFTQATAPLTPMVTTGETETRSGGNSRNIILGLVILLVLVAIGFVVFLLLFNSPAKTTPTVIPATTVQPVTNGGAAQPAATPTITPNPATTAAPTTAPVLATATPPVNAAAPQATAPASGAVRGTTPPASGGNPAGTASGTATGDRNRTNGPAEDLSNTTPQAATFASCPEAAPNSANMNCWQIQDLAKVTEVRVELSNSNATSNFTVRLVTPNNSIINLTKQAAGTETNGSFQAKNSLSSGAYSLAISPGGGSAATPESYKLLLGTSETGTSASAEAWGDQAVRVRQQGDILLILVSNRSA